MKYRALLRRNADGAERWTDWHDSTIGGNEDLGTVEYMWTEGNYACDCNRHLFFEREAPGVTTSYPCGDTAYLIVKIENEAGAVLAWSPGRGYVEWSTDPYEMVDDV